eukprot:CAMPEP_0181186248 /NCGR_PEP_ID=MMETSP1096-20121128/9934_1 /TAXON_ID=156174 ORGANISM="Chrysochromulina ericina, Strain CCMP281" /NCGR_SAMPLE_ID=MMETSP1096 /ASSEMBLY_ACC=CAM_ASM_000453 /LENGTH=131 /DNA_ID=CAMNT_0023275135 /DNA_START=64 /DNA_END=459 /DNA_ORIENTATION=-
MSRSPSDAAVEAVETGGAARAVGATEATEPEEVEEQPKAGLRRAKEADASQAIDGGGAGDEMNADELSPGGLESIANTAVAFAAAAAASADAGARGACTPGSMPGSMPGKYPDRPALSTLSALFTEASRSD